MSEATTQVQEKLRQSPAEKLHRNAFITTVSGSFGVASSVILDALVMGLFGLSSTTDAYFVASTIPMVVMTIIALQVSRVVQPMFISTREQSGEAEGWKFLNLVMTMGTWCAIIAGVIGALLSPLIIRIQAPGFDSQALAMGSTLSYFFFLVIPLACLITIMRVALNSVGEFVIAGTAKLIDSVFKIAFVATLSGGMGIVSLALGMLAGAMCQLLLFYSCLRRRGYRFGYSFSLHHPQLRRASGLMLYPLGGQVSGMAIEVISNNLSSLLGPGMVAALRFATRIIDALAGLLANGIVTVAMPGIISAVARGDDECAMQRLRQSIHLLLLVTIPVSLWLALVNRSLIALLYQRMNFTTSDVDLVSSILVLMIPYIFLSRLLGLAELPFFGSGNTRTPVLVALAKAGICVVLTYLLLYSLELYAFPIARTVSYLVASVYLLTLVSSHWGDVKLKSLTGSTIRIVTVSSVMGLFVLLGQSVVAHMPGESLLARCIGLTVPSALGGIATLCVLVPLKIVGVRRSESFPFMSVRLHVP